MSASIFDEELLGKRARLRELGVEPYPYRIETTASLAELRAREAELAGATVTVAGRLGSTRRMGKLRFMDLFDLDGRIQLFCRKDALGERTWEVLELLDPADWVGATGTLIRTKTGELSVDCASVEVLAKAVVRVPVSKEKQGQRFYPLADQDLKYRKRYLDWATDPEARARFVLRSRIVQTLREVLLGWGFLEVGVPNLELVYGGAEARPFTTRVHALDDQEVFLRISLELPLKRYIVGGFPRVFHLGQVFRNEGIDRFHNPEFSELEWYEAFTDYTDQMARFEELVSETARRVLATTRIAFQGTEVELAPPWKRISVHDALGELGGLDVRATTTEELRRLAAEGLSAGASSETEKARMGAWAGSASRGALVMTLFDLRCERHLVQPTILKDHPREVSPLTKRHRDDPDLVERFEPYICGMEVGNAYSELSDPVEQHERFVEQRRLGAASAEDEGVENHPMDMDFVEAIGCGFPPTGGVGVGVDRLVMLLADSPSIRDIIAFPMRRKV